MTARGGIDLGGTKIQAVVVNGRGTVTGDARHATPTEGGPPAVAAEMAATLAEAAEAAGVETSSLASVGVGSPGVIDTAAGTVASARNLTDWIEAFQALIGDFGPSGPSFRALEALFGVASRWEELSETLERHLDIAESDSERLELLATLGDLKREHLSDVTGSLEVYRRALRIDT